MIKHSLYTVNQLARPEERSWIFIGTRLSMILLAGFVNWGILCKDKLPLDLDTLNLLTYVKTEEVIIIVIAELTCILIIIILN